MSKLLSKSLKRFAAYAGIVLACSIPVYYFAISTLWHYELDEHNIILTPEAGREDTFFIIGAITLLTVLFFALLLGGFVWLNRRISHRLWQPFYHTLEKIRAFDLSSHTAVDFERSNIAEFEELNSSISRLLDSNISAYRQQKEFTENASHELQTPLAIVQSKLDLLMQDSSLTSAQAQIIEETNNALSRVSRINKNLLLLAKIESQQFLELKDIALSEILQQILDLLSTLFAEKVIHRKIDSSYIVKGNPILLEIMLTNLLMNAMRHTFPRQEIELSLSDNVLVISNPGMHELDRNQLFGRFSTASAHTPGSGLGLSIVKEISKRYLWNVNYSFQNGNHIFEVAF
ncbi:twp-component sensor histidine kinase [Pedobacter sp. BAL39]|uniref:sensor histidine kinase n=1 Tax=Pedobacter sp. BAL39 TaxID=391596 RepID=UPI00015592AC|nr:HAMP domain-containing sensor histidine kinase [Pedobacter sp. BAL39]EDM37947.1 twp-component sensor histidine kinase [Pedobacter sp. BAL39]